MTFPMKIPQCDLNVYYNYACSLLYKQIFGEGNI